MIVAFFIVTLFTKRIVNDSVFIAIGISEDIFSSQWRRLGGRFECSVPVDGDLVLNCDTAQLFSA